jgi:hypothetical protein
VVRLKAMVGSRAAPWRVYPRLDARAFATPASLNAPVKLIPMEWLFNLLISNDAAALFIAVVGARFVQSDGAYTDSAEHPEPAATVSAR